MKREELKKLLGDSATDEVLDKIMGLHGADIESHKTKLSETESARDGFKTQLDAANQQIEGFKGMNIDEIKAAADDYKAKFEQAQTDHAAQVAGLKFDHAIETALTGAKAKNLKAVQALLSKDTLKLNEDGTVAGLDDQLKTIKEKDAYLFEGDKPAPKIVTNTNNQPVLGDKTIEAARKAAGLTVQGK